MYKQAKLYHIFTWTTLLPLKKKEKRKIKSKIKKPEYIK